MLLMTTGSNIDTLCIRSTKERVAAVHRVLLHVKNHYSMMSVMKLAAYRSASRSKALLDPYDDAGQPLVKCV